MRRALLILLGSLVLAVPASADVVGFGYNGGWELDAGYRNGFETLPVPAVGLVGVKELASGGGSNIALLGDGTARGWGQNTYGQVGNGSRATATHPVPVHGLTGVVQIAEAAAHSIALKSDGTVWTWGSSIFGQGGVGLTCEGKEDLRCSLTTATQVPGVLAVRVYAGGADDAVLLANGTVLAWGANYQGQIGDGTVVNKPSPTLVKGVSNVRQVALGGIANKGGHALYLLNDGTVLGVGANGQGQLGTGTTASTATATRTKLSGVVAVSTSVSHTLALTPAGTVLAFGSNDYGELGIPTTEKCAKGTIACSTTPLAVTGLSNVTQVLASFRYSLAVSEGNALAWGWNQYGQLGNGTRANSPLPAPVQGIGGVLQVTAGEHHALALLAGAGPPATLSLTPGVGSLAVAWRSPVSTERWTIGVRPVTRPAHPWTFLKPSLPASARSATVSGLAAATVYEVIVKNASFGSRTVQGSTLAAGHRSRGRVVLTRGN